MKYPELKEKLLSLFDPQKLSSNPSEWAFYNETGSEVKRIAYATNITPEVIGQAGEAGAQLLLTHHDAWDFVFGLRERCNLLLSRYGITHAFFHAVLDDAGFGTNSSLAALTGLVNCRKIIPYCNDCYCGVIGELPQPLPFGEFASQLSGILHEPVREYQNTPGLVHKICIATGGGNMTNDMKHVVDAGCDTYITGEYVLYSQQYAKLHNMNLLVGSHTNTEVHGVRSMVELLADGTDVEIIRIEEPNY